MYEAIHPRTGRVLLAGEKCLLIRDDISKDEPLSDLASSRQVMPTDRSLMSYRHPMASHPTRPKAACPAMTRSTGSPRLGLW